MKKTLLFGSALIALASFCQATTLTVATPNDADNLTTLSAHFGTLINFDSLTPFSALAANTYASSGVQSIASNNSSDPLTVYPFSSQSAPNEVSTADFTGGLTITFTRLTNVVGIGVEESDGANVQLIALGATGNTLGSFNEIVPIGGPTPDNAYYILQDPTSDIRSLEVVSSGVFGVDDVQYGPEPMSFLLAGTGLSLLVFLGLRRRRA